MFMSAKHIAEKSALCLAAQQYKRSSMRYVFDIPRAVERARLCYAASACYDGYRRTAGLSMREDEARASALFSTICCEPRAHHVSVFTVTIRYAKRYMRVLRVDLPAGLPEHLLLR